MTQWTKHEIRLFEQGWISCRMAAAKLGVHVSTIHRLVYSGALKENAILQVGKTRYLKLEAFVETQEPGVRKAFQLDDWSDVVPTAPPSKRRVAK